MEELQQDKKHRLLSEAVTAVCADPRLDCLGQAKRLLEGGAWWKRARAYETKIDQACNAYSVTAEEFKEMLDGWHTGLVRGCERMRVILERKKGA